MCNLSEAPLQATPFYFGVTAMNNPPTLRTFRHR
jgi:hypothetical protein